MISISDPIDLRDDLVDFWPISHAAFCTLNRISSELKTCHVPFRITSFVFPLDAFCASDVKLKHSRVYIVFLYRQYILVELAHLICHLFCFACV